MQLNGPRGTPGRIGLSPGTRGRIERICATGEEVWRFCTLPEPGRPGSEHWLYEEAGKPDCWRTGGAAARVTGSDDAATDTRLLGTGNPVPMFDPAYRQGGFASGAGDAEQLNRTDGLDPMTGLPLSYDPNASRRARATHVRMRRDGGPTDACPHIRRGRERRSRGA
jgi:hypothetical protein